VRSSEFLYAFQVLPRVQKKEKKNSKEKIRDIKAAYPFRSLQDREFYKLILA